MDEEIKALQAEVEKKESRRIKELEAEGVKNDSELNIKERKIKELEGLTSLYKASFSQTGMKEPKKH